MGPWRCRSGGPISQLGKLLLPAAKTQVVRRKRWRKCVQLRHGRLAVRWFWQYGEADPETIARLGTFRYTDQALGNWAPGDGRDRGPLPANGERDCGLEDAG